MKQEVARERGQAPELWRELFPNRPCGNSNAGGMRPNGSGQKTYRHRAHRDAPSKPIAGSANVRGVCAPPRYPTPAVPGSILILLGRWGSLQTPSGEAQLTLCDHGAIDRRNSLHEC